jgi:hypothetical protein
VKVTVKRSGESAGIPAQELLQPMLQNQLRSAGNKSRANCSKGAEDKELEILRYWHFEYGDDPPTGARFPIRAKLATCRLSVGSLNSKFTQSPQSKISNQNH